MNAKKVLVGSVTAVTLTLFTGAVFAQQPAVPQGDTVQVSIARHEEGVRPDAQATRAGIGTGAIPGFDVRSTDRASRTVPIARLRRRGRASGT